MTEWRKKRLRCEYCGHIWVGVVPFVGDGKPDALECPNCGKMSNYESSVIEPKTLQEVIKTGRPFRPVGDGMGGFQNWITVENGGFYLLGTRAEFKMSTSLILWDKWEVKRTIE